MTEEAEQGSEGVWTGPDDGTREGAGREETPAEHVPEPRHEAAEERKKWRDRTEGGR